MQLDGCTCLSGGSYLSDTVGEIPALAPGEITMSDQTVTATSEDVPDEIVRSIHINATAQRVWDIVSEPGWFINNGTSTPHEISEINGTFHIVDPNYGAFSVGVDALEPPHRAVFRWLGGLGGSLEDFPNNTVEFTIQPDGDGVLLTVRESGFSRISDDAATRRTEYENNTEGWKVELDLARSLAESS